MLALIVSAVEMLTKQLDNLLCPYILYLGLCNLEHVTHVGGFGGSFHGMHRYLIK